MADERKSVDADVLWAIASRSDSPTYREIAADLGLAVSTVWYAVSRLRRDGLVADEPLAHRKLRLTSAGTGLTSSPS